MVGLIYVTGACGYIGSWLSKLLRKNHVSFVESCKNVSTISPRDIASVETMVHLAQLKNRNHSYKTPLKYHNNNVEGTWHLIQACNRAQVKRFVYASSAAVYGDTSPYAETKRLCEKMLNANFHGITVILRLFNVYGGADSTSVVDKFRRQPRLVVHGDGTQTRDFIHVNDVCEWIVRACSYEKSSVEDVGSGKATSILELAQATGKPYRFDVTVDCGVHDSVAKNVKCG